MERVGAVIEVEGLDAGYEARAILRDVNLAVRRGEVLVLLGGSGCGKSTLMRHMIGLNPPLAGRVKVLGEVFAEAGVETPDEVRNRILPHIGVMYQGGALFGAMTLLENVRLPLEELADLPRGLMDEIARLKLEQVGLGAFADYFPSEISGGMQKRAAIARAMALDPEVLFLDEPSAGLDPLTSAGLDELILAIREAFGTTVVMVTHELPSIFTVADRAVYLDRATMGILDEGDPRDLRDSSAHREVRNFFNRGRAPENGRKGG
ncbi:MAG: ABC transporter ATP-binding protein [Kiritimatiellia bacterium]